MEYLGISSSIVLFIMYRLYRTILSYCSKCKENTGREYKAKRFVTEEQCYYKNVRYAIVKNQD